MKKVLFFLFGLPFMAQAQGIHFESSLSWNDILDKARSENKSIFVDCYATWCGPCKYMDADIFPLKEVGEYFNAHFISVKLQMDSTSRDVLPVRDRYRDASEIKTTYRIGAYPTYLFFSPEGRPIHRFSGSAETGALFLAKASDALDPDRQYFQLMDGWEKHKDDSTYLLHALSAALDADDDQNAREMISYYINDLKNPLTRNSIGLLYTLISSETDWGFQWYLQHSAAIDKLMGPKDYVEYKLAEIIFKEEVASRYSEKGRSFDWKMTSGELQAKYTGLDKAVFAGALDAWFQNFIDHEINVAIDHKEMQLRDWEPIAARLKKQYSGYDCRQILLSHEARYYFDKKRWKEAAAPALALIDRYGAKMGGTAVNNICWGLFFLHSSDEKVLNRAIGYMEQVIKRAPEDCGDLDTYANLLYKTGHHEEAIRWENKVLEMARKQKINEKEWRDNFEKMQKGEPTWTGDIPGA